MALPDAQRVFCEILLQGRRWQAEMRPNLAEKNWLAVGTVSAADVAAMIAACKKAEYSTRPHLDDPSVVVHFFRPLWGGRRWIVKGYVLGPSATFISVHPAR